MIEFLTLVSPYLWMVLYLATGFVGALATIIYEKSSGRWNHDDLGPTLLWITFGWPVFLGAVICTGIAWGFNNFTKPIDKLTTLVANSMRKVS